MSQSDVQPHRLGERLTGDMVSHARNNISMSSDVATQFIPNMFTCRGVADLPGSTF